jgi:hypothetical protein
VNTPNASFTFAGDLEGQAAVESAAQTFTFLGGLRKVRVVGNFKPPGVNFIGALTYPDANSAEKAALGLKSVHELAQFLSILVSWGVGGKLPPMQVQQQKNEVAFNLAVDENLVRGVLRAAATAAQAFTTVSAAPPAASTKR